MRHIFIFIFLFFLHAGFSQALNVYNNAVKNYPDNKLWSDNQVYQIAKSYNIQDSLFLNPEKIKQKFILTLYMPKDDLKKLFIKLQDVYDTKRYFSEVKSVSTVDEWLDLLEKYPGFSNTLKNDKVFTLGYSFQKFVNKVKNQEILLFLRGSEVVVAENTPDEYKKFKLLKRLK